jgi:hypothetical protein
MDINSNVVRKKPTSFGICIEKKKENVFSPLFVFLLVNKSLRYVVDLHQVKQVVTELH